MTRSTAEAALARCLWRGTRHFHGKQGATRALTTTVVVSEVHSLATCSTSTACEIKQRIQTSGERAHAGSDLVRNAGTALAEVVSPIQGVSALMEAISQSIAARTSGMLGATQAIVHRDATYATERRVGGRKRRSRRQPERSGPPVGASGADVSRPQSAPPRPARAARLSV